MEQSFSQQAVNECKQLSTVVASSNSWYQAYKHIFTSLSSMEKEAKATCSGNTHLHGMPQVTPTLLAYIATQVDLRLVVLLDMSCFTSSRSTLHFPLRQYSADWTLFPTWKCSIYLSWSFSMT